MSEREIVWKGSINDLYGIFTHVSCCLQHLKILLSPGLHSCKIVFSPCHIFVICMMSNFPQSNDTASSLEKHHSQPWLTVTSLKMFVHLKHMGQNVSQPAHTLLMMERTALHIISSGKTFQFKPS